MTKSTISESRILGIKSSPVNYASATEIMNQWVRKKSRHNYVVLKNVFTVMNAYDDSYYRNVIEASAMAIPDGKPVALTNRLKGFKETSQTRGPEFMYRYLQQSVEKGIKHFFMGGAEGIPEKLKAFFEKEFPGIRIVGTYSPPFRKLSDQEDQEICQMINDSGADMVWVGLGAPKQDIWMYEHKDKLQATALIGVGAAFDFWTGNLKIAPRWMQVLYLEWLHRWFQEPRRLFKRYMIHNPRYIFHTTLELLKLKEYKPVPLLTFEPLRHTNARTVNKKYMAPDMSKLKLIKNLTIQKGSNKC